MTKALASVAALQLVEQGRLGLDDEVGAVLPEWKELKVLDGWDGDVPRLREPRTQATIRQLLTHTAGHGYYFVSADLLKYHEVTGVPNVLSGLRTSLATPLQSDPGTRWEYGINTDWLGLVVEAVSGQTLDLYLAEHLFAPLGMDDTSFTVTPQQRAAMMPVHARTPDGGLVVTDLDFPSDPEWMAGGHGAYSTAEDYGRFLSMLLREGTAADGARVLEGATIDLALSDHLGTIAYPAVIETAVPEVTNSIENLPVQHGWGLGFHLTLDDLEGMRRGGAGDWAGIFNCYYWVDRNAGLGGVFLTQVLPFFDQRCVETAVGVELAAYAEQSSATGS
jgi:CubicO group peptidase (beta-lactamase class C family)